MRLDARLGDRHWYVWDVKRCRHVRECVWCDEESAQWGGFRQPYQADLHGELALDVHQEERIRIYPDRKLVLFNEVDDPAQDELQQAAVHFQPGALSLEIE